MNKAFIEDVFAAAIGFIIGGYISNFLNRAVTTPSTGN